MDDLCEDLWEELCRNSILGYYAESYNMSAVYEELYWSRPFRELVIFDCRIAVNSCADCGFFDVDYEPDEIG